MRKKAILYAIDQCACLTCPISCKLRWLIDMDGSCDKFNRYVRNYEKEHSL